jgi:D-alanine-D-alanine ligase
MHQGKLRIGILFGGQSAEHEISLLSARRIIDHLNPEKYDVSLIGIDKQGKWHLYEKESCLDHSQNLKTLCLTKPCHAVVLSTYSEQLMTPIHGDRTLSSLDLEVIFPVLHGPNGEDGSVQGLCKLAGIPFVGASVLSSAISMDKDVSKRLLRNANLPVVPFLIFHAHDPLPSFSFVQSYLGLPLFIKPANLGSSIGITKVKEEAAFADALSYAFQYDRKILIEKAIIGKEFECGVLGNVQPIPSVVGEIRCTADFYTYDAKYVGGTKALIPAPIPQALSMRIQEMAVKAYQTVCCEGMARIDFLCDEKETLYINEINTLPGCTPLSPFPALWEASGMPFSEFLDRVIALALERHAAETSIFNTRRACNAFLGEAF